MSKPKKGKRTYVTVGEAGRRGGKARVANQTPEERTASARNAAKVRWARKRNAEPKKKRK